jgi:glyoxylase-like metal-dependent hydrolase (beta-lactamase superfamily II)
MNPPHPRHVRAANRSPMTLDGTRTFLVGSRRPVVIDPGPEDEIHLEAVVRALDGAAPRAILLTHAHSDHAGNAVALAERTGAPIWMGEGAIRLPFATARVDRWLRDGDRVECDGEALRVLATPGHTPEHLAFHWGAGDRGGTLFAGDLFLGAGDTTLVSHPEGSVADYLRSLEVVAELSPALVYPAHGPSLRRPEAALRRFREHRLRRIDGDRLDPRLRGGARGSVRAILEYLEAGSAG